MVHLSFMLCGKCQRSATCTAHGAAFVAALAYRLAQSLLIISAPGCARSQRSVLSALRSGN